MHTQDLDTDWEQRFVDYFCTAECDHSDASHDLAHFRRVANTAQLIAATEAEVADPLILLAAAYFHDVVSLPKNHPENKMSSRFSAVKAKEILTNMHFPKEKILSVCHAIETHSFSAQLQPETIEAKIIQDADRMESLGALGVLRTFYVSGRLGRTPYDPADMCAEKRPLDDKAFCLDHFYCKLFKLPALLQTESGRKMANKRAAFLQFFVDHLILNVQQGEGGALILVWACYHAGQHSLKLFDTADPMVTDRPLDPHQFVVDRLISEVDRFPFFISAFLTQLSEEIELPQKVPATATYS